MVFTMQPLVQRAKRAPKKQQTSKMVEDESNGLSKEDKQFIEDHKYMVRPCEQYRAEYRECRRIKGRFHQYFIFGEFLDCDPWQTDYVSCQKWENEQDVKSFKRIIVNESIRKVNRFKPHEENDIWERRTSPPENWNSDPPKWFTEQNDHSFLAMKSNEEKRARESGQILAPEKSSCVIS